MRHLDESLQTSVPDRATDGPYLIGQWLDSKACGLSRLSDLVSALNHNVRQIKVRISQIDKASASTWRQWFGLAPKPHSLGIHQDMSRLVASSNLLIDKDFASCAPRAFESIDRYMLEGQLHSGSSNASYVYMLQYTIIIPVAAIIFIFGMVGLWGMERGKLPTANENSYLFCVLFWLVLAGIVAAYLFPYNQATAYG